MSLLALNAVLVFALAFIVGGQFAKAQSGDAQADNYLAGSGDGSGGPTPATAMYPEFKDQLDATVFPEIPKPGEEVSITLEVYSFDINSVQTTWRVDGAVVEKGVGIKKFKFHAGPAGKSTTVSVVVEPADRPSITKTFTFKTGDVDLLWQSDVYVPPFYKGKSLYTPESNLTFVAMPRTSNGLVNPKSVVFNWKIDYEADAENSGYGRNAYRFEGPIIIRPVDVSVETYEAKGGKAAATADITVDNYDPFSLFYENHPVYGVLFNRALAGGIILKKSELGLSAYPYFESIQGKNSGLEYLWSVDGMYADIPTNQNTITLRKNQGDTGQSAVNLQMTNPNKILQSLITGIQINFDTTRNPIGL
jgi:hypothetical protein